MWRFICICLITFLLTNVQAFGTRSELLEQLRNQPEATLGYHCVNYPQPNGSFKQVCQLEEDLITNIVPDQFDCKSVGVKTEMICKRRYED